MGEVLKVTGKRNQSLQVVDFAAQNMAFDQRTKPGSSFGDYAILGHVPSTPRTFLRNQQP